MKRSGIILLIVSFFVIQRLSAQELSYQVYQFETPYQGHIVLKSLDTYISNSDLANEHYDKIVKNENLWGHSFEAEFAVLDHLELDAYADFATPQDGNFSFAQTHFSALYRVGERFDNFVNIAFYGEYYIPRKSYSTSQEAEFRLVLDKDLEDFRIVANPNISKYTTGDEDKKLHAGLDAAIYYRRIFAIQPGVEYYANYSEHTGVIFPTIVLNLTPSISWNIGAGFGLTNQSDNLIFKSNLAFDIQAIRPSKLFRKPYHPVQ
ncbi:MAG TPA: hypothetical protein VHB70_08505 [Parafilimonas sp.]|nr:hypothetical protein [Parafilimonas sp.]